MAEKPIKIPLPADLPEDWNAGQIVAPDGTAVGLTERHGYNYLMAAVNRAQRGVNEVNEAFGTVSGKRPCRFVVGTSAAGWTEADCDFLCDGVDDQEEIQQAVNALLDAGGEIVLLDGRYQLTQEVSVYNLTGSISISGNPGSTVISGEELSVGAFTSSFFKCFVEGITFESSQVSGNEISLFIRNCLFIDTTVYFTQQEADRSCVFFCNGNEFRQSGNNSVISVSLICRDAFPRTPCTISNNVIHAEKASDVLRFMNGSVENGAYTILGNIITCRELCKIFTNTSGNIIGNSLYNCGIYSYSGTAVVGNRLLGGSIVAEAVRSDTSIAKVGATVSGNYLQDGRISAVGNVSLTGNSVVIVSDNTIESAIRLRKNASNNPEDQSPAIVGNYVAGSLCGILLEEPGTSMGNKNCRNAMVNSNRIYGAQTPIKIGAHWSGCMVTDNLFTTGTIEDNGENNIVRFNSDDTSGGGSTPATVQQATPTITVNADGAVTARATQAAGYVAAGTRSATYQLSNADDTDLTPENIKDGVSIFGVVGTLETGGGTAGVTSFNGRSGEVRPGNNDYTADMVGAVESSAAKDIQAMTQAEYDALASKSPTTLYLIKE